MFGSRVRSSKKNPWRNTRNDFNMPWNDILASIFMILLPIVIFLTSFSIVIRSESFYSFYFTKSAIARDIPYEISGEDLSKHFGDFMKHRKADLSIKEKSDYKPQQVFSKRAIVTADSIRSGADIAMIFAIITGISIAIILLYLYKQEERHLIYDSFESSVIWFIVIIGIFSVSIFIRYVRTLIFRQLFGVRFEAGDVFIQIMKSDFPNYFGGAVIIVSLLLMIIIFYIMNRLFSYRRMFIRSL